MRPEPRLGGGSAVRTGPTLPVTPVGVPSPRPRGFSHAPTFPARPGMPLAWRVLCVYGRVGRVLRRGRPRVNARLTSPYGGDRFRLRYVETWGSGPRTADVTSL